MYYSFIVPVYNRPQEVDELLESLTKLDSPGSFEVVIIEDGSTIDSQQVVQKYKDLLQISYYYKANSGPGDSRNYGMKRAKGDYFIILDSDCIIPPGYLTQVRNYLEKNYVDFFGGPDAALDNFSDIQKAINFAMTSVLTTGGIRGSSQVVGKFQPRSFNMGISKKAFLHSNGFGKIHPGEDPDLAIRLWELGYESKLLPKAYVYHKRRIDWKKFFIQVNKFGKARPILNKRYPDYKKITYWFPFLFIFGLALSIIGGLFGYYFGIWCYGVYLLLIFISASLKENNLKIGALSLWATLVQFYGYGTGFIKSYFRIFVLKQVPEAALPEMFFK
ncbi:glycosyltransferase family 2 protein [Myroides sp. LJL119]